MEDTDVSSVVTCLYRRRSAQSCTVTHVYGVNYANLISTLCICRIACIDLRKRRMPFRLALGPTPRRSYNGVRKQSLFDRVRSGLRGEESQPTELYILANIIMQRFPALG